MFKNFGGTYVANTAPAAESAASEQITQSEVDEASPGEIKLDTEFKKIRNTMKNGFVRENMFQINKLTDKIVEIIIRLYHVNIQCVHKDNNNSNRGKLTMMSGILEDNHGNIYVTISEDPREDDKFYDKLNYFIKLLHNCNIEIIYPEYNLKNDVNDDIKQQNKVGNDKIIKNPEEKTPEQSKFISKIDNIKGNYGVNVPTDYNDEVQMFYNVDISTPITVNLINSVKYLEKRINGKRAFEPFPKADILESNGVKTVKNVKCNNGSTCTEAKLFSYLYDNDKKWSDIKGGIAYWIKNDFPPDHVIKSYNYDEDDNNEDSEENTNIKSNLPENELHKLTKLSQLIYDYKRPEYSNNFLKYINNNENYNKILKSIFRPIALPCPGCYMNFRNGNYQNEKYILGTDYNQLCSRTFTDISKRNDALQIKFNNLQPSLKILESSANAVTAEAEAAKAEAEKVAKKIEAEKAAKAEAAKAEAAKAEAAKAAEALKQPKTYAEAAKKAAKKAAKLKYLKYKNKYLALKKKLELNNI